MQYVEQDCGLTSRYSEISEDARFKFQFIKTVLYDVTDADYARDAAVRCY